jgi:hypothetical protein
MRASMPCWVDRRLFVERRRHAFPLNAFYLLLQIWLLSTVNSPYFPAGGSRPLRWIARSKYNEGYEQRTRKQFSSRSTRWGIATCIYMLQHPGKFVFIKITVKNWNFAHNFNYGFKCNNFHTFPALKFILETLQSFISGETSPLCSIINRIYTYSIDYNLFGAGIAQSV